MAGVAVNPRLLPLLRRSTPIKPFGIGQLRAVHFIAGKAVRQQSRRNTGHSLVAETSDTSSKGNVNKQETFNSDEMDDSVTQSVPLADLISTRLGEPEAVDSPEYSGNVLPFPDRLAQTPSEPKSFKPPANFIPGCLDSLEATETSQSLSTANRSEMMIQTADTLAKAPELKIKKIFTGRSDPFLQIIPGTGRTKPDIYDDIDSLRAYRREVAQRGYTVGFVPTMGALHEGHLDLIRAAAMKCHEVWVSIYVNPTQFGANEDLSTYPSTWAADLAKIEKLNDQLLSKGYSRVSTIFRPGTPQVLYPYGVDGTSHVVMNPEVTQILEGSSRPTFFRGVTTVVMKLLNIVQPDRVYFGQKDIQQFTVIKRMIKEFHMPVQIERVPTMREASGLAMSSRNAYLGRRRLKAATVLHKMLSAAKAVFNSAPASQRTRKILLDAAMKVYNEEKDLHEGRVISKPSTAVQFKLDYLSLADPETLREVPDKVGPQGAVMSLAIYFQPLKKEFIRSGEQLGINGDETVVRLIDNELLGVDKEVGANHRQDLEGGFRI